MPDVPIRSLVPRVFICYARHDNDSRKRGIRWRDRLMDHLRPFVTDRRLEVFYDEQTRTADEWDETIQQQLAACDVAVLLVSKDFLNSEYIRTREVPLLLERHAAKQTRLVPVLVGACVWKEVRYGYGETKSKSKSLSAIQAPIPTDPPLDRRKPADRKAALARIAETVLAEAMAQKPAIPLPPAELRPYLGYVIERCRFVPMRGAQQDQRSRHGDPQRLRDDPDERIELERVFVDLDTTHVPRSERTDTPADPLLRGQAEPDGFLAPTRESEPPWPALFAIVQPDSRHVVLKGAPGSGKSTLVRFLMLALAECGHGNAATWSPRIPHWPASELTVIPVRIELRLFDAWARQQDFPDPKPCHLWDFFLFEYRKLRTDRSWPEPGSLLEEAARDGRIAFFFDGLDEVASVVRKVFVRDCIQEFAHRGLGAHCRVLVTSRTRAYDLALPDNQTLHLRIPKPSTHGPCADWPVYELAGFDPEQQDQFVKAWYDVLRVLEADLESVASERTVALQTALRDPEKPELGEMGQSPLLLTVMAHLHSSQRDLRLPDNRAELLEDFVDLLLRRWAERHRPQGPSAADSDPAETLGDLLADPGVAGVTPETFLQMLARIAFEGFKSGSPEKPPLVSGSVLTRELRRLYKGLDSPPAAAWAEKVLLYVQHRAGLLHSPDGEIYDFPHRLVWEYLTAFHLARTCDAADIANRITSDGYWDEVIRLVAGHFVFVKHEIARGLKLVKALASSAPKASDCPSVPPRSDSVAAKREKPKRRTAEADDGPRSVGWRKLTLAADSLHEIGPDKRRQEPDDDAPCLELLRDGLPRLLASGALSARDRARAGRILGHLGDPRRGVVPETLQDLPAIEFCLVPTDPPPGSRPTSSLPNQKPQATASRRKSTAAGSSMGFWIARYPVTVAQFRLFATPENYRNREWWDVAEKAGFWRDGQVKVTNWDGTNERWVDRPETLDTRFEVPNHPVISVNWFEAMAFAQWFDRQVRKARVLPEGTRIRLPTESEWQRAAQGGGRIPRDPAGNRCRLGELNERMEIRGDSLQPNPYPERSYPWGDEELEEQANWHSTSIGGTSAVGCFEAGTSPVGAEEMAGNVWEWTTSWYDTRKTVRVLRGGSWGFGLPDSLRAAMRIHCHPGYRVDLLGFRLLCGGESC